MCMNFGCIGPKHAALEYNLKSSHKGDLSVLDGKYLYGVAYYPEQWDSSRWELDFAKMKELGINTVRMGEFAWSRFEPREGRFEFDWMDKAINLAASHGIKTILCTPTASIPPRLVKAHPEVLSGNREGQYSQGVRKGHNSNSYELLRANDRIVQAMAAHFGNNPNIIGWQLDNEPGYPFTMNDAISEMAFRDWLKDRYKTIDALNTAWTGAFWSLEYTSWDEIHLPPLNRADGGSNPGQVIDSRRFFSDSFLSYLKRQEVILRKHIGNRYIYINWPNTFWSMNIFECSAMLDFNGWDNYSFDPGVTDYRKLYGVDIHHDLCRSANADQYFIISEQPPQSPACASPKGVWLRTMMGVAHGAYGTLFFEWRPPIGGGEQGCSSVLELDGNFGPSYPQLIRLGMELPKLAEALKGSKTISDLAVLYSYDNQWIQGWWMGNYPQAYDNVACDYYVALKSLKRNVDVISENHFFKDYKIIAAPGLQVVSDDLAKRLLEYARDGGTLIINHQTGTKDTFNRFRELPSPGVFALASGMEAAWVGSDIAGKNIKKFKIKLGNLEFEPATCMELLHLQGAETLATFSGGELEGKPAVTFSRYGKGYIVYVGTDATSQAFYEAVLKVVANRLHIEPLVDVPQDVEVTTMQTANELFYFIVNLTDSPRDINIKEPLVNVLNGKNEEKTIELSGLDAIVLKQGRK